MRPKPATYRNGATAVYTTTLFERGRAVTLFDVWCEHLDCESRGCLDSYRRCDAARRRADGHQHRILPAYASRRWRRKPWSQAS